MSARLREHGLFARVMRDERLWVLGIGVVVFLILFQAFSFYRLPLLSGKQDATDFVAFHTVGQMVWEGIAPQAYHKALFEQHLRSFGQIDLYMAWAYPPQAFFLVAPLGLMPIWLAYAVYGLATLALFCHVLKRLAGPWAPGAFAAALPAAIINARSGQTGFLVAALVGLFLIELRHSRARAGLPLGLMIIKPHLAVGIAVLALVERQGKAVALAACVVIASALIASLAFGWGIWGDFLTGIQGSGKLLAEANFPLSRMISVYAVTERSGLSPGAVLGVHLAVGLMALGAVGWLKIRRVNRDLLMAAAVMAGLFVSPYGYDYDLTVLALAAALVSPALAARARSWELGGLFALAWAASANSQLMLAQMLAIAHIIPHQGRMALVSFSAVALVLLALSAILILTRKQYK